MSVTSSKTLTAPKTMIIPYLFFAGRCEEAMNFYTQAIGAKVGAMMRWSDSPEPPPPGSMQAGFEKKIMHAEFAVDGVTIFAADGCSDKDGSKHEGYRLALTVATEAAARAAFEGLSRGGSVQMPLTPTFWSPLFGMVTDKFNVGWMVMVHQATT